MIHWIETPCKLCHKPARTFFEDGADPAAVDKFLPMVAHDRCADLTRRRRDLRDKIIDLCFMIERTPDMKEEARDKVRALLTKATKALAETLMDTYRAKTLLWSPDFVDLLMEQPKQSPRIIREYHDEVRRAAGMSLTP